MPVWKGVADALNQYPPDQGALVDQAFHGTTQVSCPLGPVVAVSRWKGQLRVMIRGWGRWYPVESVRIEGVGVALLQEGIRPHLLGTRRPLPQVESERALQTTPADA